LARQLNTRHEPVSCDVCGRSLLRGEHASVFLDGGARRQVCELCTTRAAHEGWIREGADDVPAARPRGDRARSLVGRLRSRLEEGPPNGPEGTSAERMPHAAEPRHVHAVPTNAELKVARALELFNRSEHTRTVAGVARSLGGPSVVVRPVEGVGRVEILVAWELCWYRYEVDLTDDSDAVRLQRQGDELAELDEEDYEPNALADARGELSVATSE
jgi:hypothetical protein